MTVAVVTRDPKRPPPLPSSTKPAAGAPPPLASMRVPKGVIPHGQELDVIDVDAAVLRARRATEEREWQAQVKRAKDALAENEAAEWEALRARTVSLPVDETPRAPKPEKPRSRPRPSAPLIASAPAKPNESASHSEAEEREWQELRARARADEEREWQALMARARAATAVPARPRTRSVLRVVAWP